MGSFLVWFVKFMHNLPFYKLGVTICKNMPVKNKAKASVYIWLCFAFNGSRKMNRCVSDALSGQAQLGIMKKRIT